VLLDIIGEFHLLIFLQVRLFNLSRLSGRGPDDNVIPPSALYQCHSRRVKKLAVRSLYKFTVKRVRLMLLYEDRNRKSNVIDW
jgi:hypothetical protein